MLRRAFCAAFVSAASAAVSLFLLSQRGLLFASRPDRHEYPCTGVYVTGESGSISWKTFAAESWDICYVRVSSGTAFADRRGAYNLKGAAASGKLYGAVHDLDPALDGKAQADNFLSVTGTLAGQLVPAVDIRLSLAERLRYRDEHELARRVNGFVQRIREREGCGAVLLSDGYVYEMLSLGESGALVWTDAGSCPEPFLISYSENALLPGDKGERAVCTLLSAGRNISRQELSRYFTVRRKNSRDL